MVQRIVNEAVEVLRQGGLVAYPTDTVYGLGAALDQTAAIERIFEVKGRPKGMALPLLVSDREMLKRVASSIPAMAWLFIYNFLPGGLTLVLPKSGAVPDIVAAGGRTVAVRIPDHPVPLALIRRLGAPIVGTSANLSGQHSALTADEVKRQLGDRVDLVIDGGRCAGGTESTVVDVSGKKPVILRQGAVSLEQLRQARPDIEPVKEQSHAYRRR